MTMQYLERELRVTGDPRDEERADIISAIHEARGKDIPMPKAPQTAAPAETAPLELDLEVEWQRQASNYIKLGYHTELGLTEQAYLASLPKFEPQPEEYEGNFDRPLLVEKRIPWEKQAELAGIELSEYLRSNLAKTQRWGSSHSKAPEDKPYTGWFNKWGQRFVNKIRPIDAIVQLTADEVGGDLFEGVAQEIHHPEDTANGRYFDLIGYQVESDDVVDLDRWRGGPRLNARWGGNANGGWRPLVRGSKIGTG